MELQKFPLYFNLNDPLINYVNATLLKMYIKFIY